MIKKNAKEGKPLKGSMSRCKDFLKPTWEKVGIVATISGVLVIYFQHDWIKQEQVRNFQEGWFREQCLKNELKALAFPYERFNRAGLTMDPRNFFWGWSDPFGDTKLIKPSHEQAAKAWIKCK